ncbi:hypothetical protein OAH22_00540 [bacterium]|nr:hypothetical protein [bacterium]
MLPGRCIRTIDFANNTTACRTYDEALPTAGTYTEIARAAHTEQHR